MYPLWVRTSNDAEADRPREQDQRIKFVLFASAAMLAFVLASVMA